MFALETFASVKLTNINPRIEKHGAESVPAVDLNFTLNAANSLLEQFNPDLLLALYGEAEEGNEEQEELDGVEPVSLFTVLQNPLPGDTTPDKPLTATDVFIAGAAPGSVH